MTVLSFAPPPLCKCTPSPPLPVRLRGGGSAENACQASFGGGGVGACFALICARTSHRNNSGRSMGLRETNQQFIINLPCCVCVKVCTTNLASQVQLVKCLSSRAGYMNTIDLHYWHLHCIHRDTAARTWTNGPSLSLSCDIYLLSKNQESCFLRSHHTPFHFHHALGLLSFAPLFVNALFNSAICCG